jgi:uncharacterized protein YegP (UPF0339 family)
MKRQNTGTIRLTDKGKRFKKGRFFVTLVSSNGRKVNCTETYNTRRSAMNAIDAIVSITKKHVLKEVRL